MKRRNALIALALVVFVASAGWTYFKKSSTGVDLTAAAEKYLSTLDKKQLAVSQLKYDTPKRVGWHFIPKDYRKGLQIKEMNKEQRKAAHALLRTTLSKAGYDKATKIMALENVLNALEGGKSRFARDPLRYYFTVFGKPTADGRWGLSIEGHHLSLNFVVEDGKVISSTPTFFAANPAIVKNATKDGAKMGARVLAKEEQLAFDLLASLSKEQRAIAVIADKAPKEIRAAGKPQPPQDKPVGLLVGKMNRKQYGILRSLIHEYAQSLPSDIAQQRLQALSKADPRLIRFAWAGAQKPGIGHYYRIEGPTFLIEFVNTQPDPAGNPANHIHCIWRDPQGDFAIPIKK